MPEAAGCRSTFWLTCATLDPATTAGRDAVIDRLALADIEARPVWKPMHLQPIFAGARALGGRTAQQLFERGICLPSGSNLTETDRRTVIDLVLEASP